MSGFNLVLCFVAVALGAVAHGWKMERRGYRQGRADAFAEVQRWHLEDDEALKQAADQANTH